jgi:DNA polymerase III gamma/tau subunit
MDKKQTASATETVDTAMKNGQEMLQKMFEVPNQISDIMIKSGKEMQEASMAHFQNMERIQRQYMQDVSKVWSAMLPGENKIWDAQMQMLENSYEMFDRMMAVGKK